MKAKVNHKPKSASLLREEIMKSMIASFKIEGITIPNESAISTLKKIEFNLEK